jgi:DNA-binding Lrp family transcriptional regulator
VKYIIDSLPEIAKFIPEGRGNWRKLLQKERVKEFSKPLADNLLDMFKNNKEVVVEKDLHYSNYGSVLLKDFDVYHWYPYHLIELLVFNVDIQDIIEGLSRRDTYVTLKVFDQTILELTKRKMNVDFKPREIEFIKLLFKERNESATTLDGHVLNFKQLAERLNMRADTVKNYWQNLDKFFQSVIVTNPASLNLHPVYITHSRELTELEKRFTYISFFDHDKYHSLVYLPGGSTWIEQNVDEDANFNFIGKFDEMIFNINLDHLTPQRTNRWGHYPGLKRPSIMNIRKSDIHLSLTSNIACMPNKKDLKIIDELQKTTIRYKHLANYLGVSTSYINQRIAKLWKEEVIVLRFVLHFIGLDSNYYLVVHSRNEPVIIQQVKKALLEYPTSIIFICKDTLYALVGMPSRWLPHYIHELTDLFNPGGEWEIQGARMFTASKFSRGSKRPRINFSEMVNKSGTQFSNWLLI